MHARAAQKTLTPQLLLTHDFPPMGGGIARWMGELPKRYPAGSLVVSTGHFRGDKTTDSQYPNRIDRVPVPSERLRTLQGLFAWSRRAAWLAASSQVEFVWCGNLKPATYPARWIKRRLGVPYGVVVHGGDLLILQHQIRRSWLKRRVARSLLRNATVIVANSGWTGDLGRSILSELEIPATKVRTVPLGSDPVLFRPGVEQTEVRSRYGLDGRKWLLTVARLSRHKGIDTGIRVLASLAKSYPELGYAVVGSGNEHAALASLAKELGIADRVRVLTGVSDADLPALYNCARMYLGLSRLMPDQVEGFGISLSEAAACGLAVVAGNTGGIPEAVRSGETGVLVDPDNLDQVCGAVRGLLDDPDLAQRMGQAGRRAVETYYNWDRVAADLSRIGQELGKPFNREAVPHDDPNH